MVKELTTNGDTSRIERVFLPDSSSTTGAGLTGLTISSAGLIISTIADNEAAATVYTQSGSTIETIATLGTYAAPTATKCRFKEVDAANHPGLYEIQLADARYAISNSEKLIITISGATNLAPTFAELQLAKLDVYDSVRAGLTALPNAAADGVGGLPISDAGGLDLDAKLANTNEVTAVRMATLTDWIDGGRLDTLLDAIPTTAMRGTDNGALGTVCTEVRLAELAAANLPADVDTLLARLTVTRANLLDNIPAGLMPTQAEVLSIQNNTRTTIGIPTVAERPDAGSTLLKIYLNNYDTVGNMEAPDSAPTVTVENESGTTRNGNLQHPTTHVPQTTMVNLSVGRYWIEYDLDNGDALESLTFTFSIIEGGATRVIDRVMLVVDTTAVDFTAADRTKLDTLHDTRLTAARAANLDEITVARMGALTDWIDGGRLDLILDAIPTTAMRGTNNAALATSLTTAQNDLDIITGSDGVTLAMAEDVYHADIDLSKDDANTKDEYSITWFKNGVRITSGITAPTIQVVKRTDGTDLIASTAMTQIGTTGSYKYDEATNRITAGEAVLVIVVATIDSGSRSFARVISRDSS